VSRGAKFIFDLADMRGVQPFEKAGRFGQIEFRIARFDAQEKRSLVACLTNVAH